MSTQAAVNKNENNFFTIFFFHNANIRLSGIKLKNLAHAGRKIIDDITKTLFLLFVVVDDGVVVVGRKINQKLEATVKQIH